MSRLNSIFNITNEHEDFIRKIIEKTENGSLVWTSSVTNSFIVKFVVDSEKAFRIFTSSIMDRNLIMVEKKIPIWNDDFNDYYDERFQELYIISNENLDTVLSNLSVFESLLSELSKIIAKKVSNLDNFFKSIE